MAYGQLTFKKGLVEDWRRSLRQQGGISTIPVQRRLQKGQDSGVDPQKSAEISSDLLHFWVQIKRPAGWDRCIPCS